MSQLPEGVEIGRMPIGSLITVFVIYVAIHLAIAVMVKKKKEELDNMSIEHPDYGNLTKTVKWLDRLFKWFPAIALVFILIGFYI